MLAILLEKREKILEAVGRHGAGAVRIFGSALTTNSPRDVDILVRMNASASLLDEIALQQELAVLLNTDVDLVTEEGLSPFLREEVLRTAQTL